MKIENRLFVARVATTMPAAEEKEMQRYRDDIVRAIIILEEEKSAAAKHIRDIRRADAERERPPGFF